MVMSCQIDGNTAYSVGTARCGGVNSGDEYMKDRRSAAASKGMSRGVECGASMDRIARGFLTDA